MKKLFTLFLSIISIVSTAAELPEYFKKESRTIFRHAALWESTGNGVFLVKDAAGKLLGKLYTETYGDAKRKFGYAGTIEVAVLTDFKGRVAGVLVGKNKETPRFLKRVHKAKFLKQWNKIHLKDVAGKKVDAVTGATLSSRAIEHGVRQIAAEATQTVPNVKNSSPTEEITRLKKMQTNLKQNLARMEQIRKQLKNRKDEVEQMHLLNATKGEAEAKKFALQNKLIYYVRNPRQAPAIHNALAKWKENSTQSNLDALRKAIAADSAKQLSATETPHEQNIKKRLDSITQQLQKLVQSEK